MTPHIEWKWKVYCRVQCYASARISVNYFIKISVFEIFIRNIDVISAKSSDIILLEDISSFQENDSLSLLLPYANRCKSHSIYIRRNTQQI